MDFVVRTFLSVALAAAPQEQCPGCQPTGAVSQDDGYGLEVVLFPGLLASEVLVRVGEEIVFMVAVV